MPNVAKESREQFQTHAPRAGLGRSNVTASSRASPVGGITGLINASIQSRGRLIGEFLLLLSYLRDRAERVK